MRWRDLTWLERIWVYNSVVGVVASIVALVLVNKLYDPPKSEVTVTFWLLLVFQICWGICLLMSLVSTAERLLGRGADWRARRALLTRGMRGVRRPGHHAVIAYPEGGRVMMRVSRYQWRPRPWPLAMPVRLEDYGDFSRSVDADDQAGLMDAFAEMTERARRSNQEEARRLRLRDKNDAASARVNAQRT